MNDTRSPERPPPSAWADLPGIVLRAVRSGDGPRRVVLLHELGGTLESFDGVVSRLGPTVATLRYDQRGTGRSEKPRAPGAIGDHAADLAALLSWAGWTEPVLLVGVAAACAILVEFAATRPAAVAGLLL